MKKSEKSKGITLVEVIISLAILVIAMAGIYLMFSSSQRTVVDTELKSQLQYEAQVIQERLSTIGAQAQGITGITLEDGIPKELKITSYKKDSDDISTGSFEDYVFTFNDNILELNGVVLSKNVDEFTIEAIDGKSYEETKAVKMQIILVGEKGYSKNRYEVSTIINFRN